MIGEALPEGDPLRAPALARMDGLPEGDRVCHGDLHPDNILCGGEKLVVIDWMNACAGDPAADAARTVLMLRSPHMPPGVPAYVRLLSRLFKKIVLGAYLKEYLRSGLAGRGEIEAWMPAVAAARLAEGLPGEGPWLRGLVEGGKPWER
jgi:aminoglycoside phosphotransferase (APT) family kinase protein